MVSLAVRSNKSLLNGWMDRCTNERKWRWDLSQKWKEITWSNGKGSWCKRSGSIYEFWSVYWKYFVIILKQLNGRWQKRLECFLYSCLFWHEYIYVLIYIYVIYIYVNYWKKFTYMIYIKMHIYKIFYTNLWFIYSI